MVCFPPYEKVRRNSVISFRETIEWNEKDGSSRLATLLIAPVRQRDRQRTKEGRVVCRVFWDVSANPLAP